MLLRTAEPAIVLAAFVAAVVSVATWSLRGERRNTAGSPAPFVGAFLCAMAALLAAGVAAASASGIALKRGRTLLAAGEAAGAAADLARAARRAPWLEDGWISLARAEMRVAERSPEGGERDLRFAAAEADLAAAGSWHPRLPQIALERAHLLSRWGEATAEPEPRRARFDAAVERFREAIAMDPQNSAAHRGLGAALLALGDVAAAREALERSARLAPRSVEGRLMLARAALAAGDVESGRREIGEARAVDAARTRQILETLVRSRPRDVSAYRDLALLDLIEGRGAQARLALEQAMRIAEPNELGPLARLLSEAGAPR
jgi:tetratricopeptide (TPR) repeat protein